MSKAPKGSAPRVEQPAAAPEAAPAVRKERKPNPLVTLYLSFYNGVSAVVWSYIIVLIVAHFASGGAVATLFKAVELPLKVIQTSAILEVVHIALGLVKSDIVSTAMQGACARPRAGRRPLDPPDKPH